MADEKIEYGLKENADGPSVFDEHAADCICRCCAQENPNGIVDVVLERCAKLVETSHTAHDLHAIAATIRGWKTDKVDSGKP